MLPVGVIDLKLDELGFRVFRQDFVELVGGRVERKADMADPSCLFLFEREVPQVEILEYIRALVAEVMEQVEVDVIGPEPLQ